MKILNVLIQKGGTGKSETVKNLAYGLAEKGVKVLVVDLDTQANTSSTLLRLNEVFAYQTIPSIKKLYDEKTQNSTHLTGAEGIEILHEFMKKTVKDCDISDVLINPKRVREAIIDTKYKNISIIPSSIKLSETDMRLKASPMKVDTRLSVALSEVEDEYDVCIIDNAPTLNSITINGITACKNEDDLIIFPLKIENAGLEGIDSTLQQMEEIIEYSPELGFDFKLLFTMRNRNKTESEMENLLRYIFPNRCFDTTIRYQAKPPEEASENKKILIESSKSNVAEDYRNFVDEVYVYLSLKDKKKAEL